MIQHEAVSGREGIKPGSRLVTEMGSKACDDSHYRRRTAAEFLSSDAGSDAECGRFCRRARKAAAVNAGEGGFTLRGDGASAPLIATARRCATVKVVFQFATLLNKI